MSPTVTLNYGLRYDVEIPPKFAAPQGLALPAYNLLGLQKAFRPTKIISSRASASHGIRMETARLWCARPMDSSMTILCSAFTSSAMRPTVRRADSWRLRELRFAPGRAIPPI